MVTEGEKSMAAIGGISEEDVLSCIRCGLCSNTCPVYRVKLTQSFSPRGRVALLRAVNQGDTELGEEFGRRFYSCTLCAACTQVCPSGVKVDDLLLSAREELAGQGWLTPNLVRLSETIQDSHNISGEDNALRLIWAENLARPPLGRGKQQADVAYFVGCVSSFFPRAYSIPGAFVQTLDTANVDYTLLGGEEWCCGYPLLANGLLSEAEALIRHNVQRVLATGATTAVFTCPSCYHLWKHTYPQFVGDDLSRLKVLHATEFLAELLEGRKLPLRELALTAVYHDPCDLGRKSKLYDAPRRALRAIPGLTLVEMSDNREAALCCGGGGNLESYDPDLVAALSARRLAQAQEANAQVIVSACQQCERTLANACRRQKARLRVVDIAELVWEAVEK